MWQWCCFTGEGVRLDFKRELDVWRHLDDAIDGVGGLS